MFKIIGYFCFDFINFKIICVVFILGSNFSLIDLNFIFFKFFSCCFSIDVFIGMILNFLFDIVVKYVIVIKLCNLLIM